MSLTQAVILAGGRSQRLGGVPKASLRLDGVTLLRRALLATTLLPDGVAAVSVVGPAAQLRPWLGLPWLGRPEAVVDAAAGAVWDADGPSAVQLVQEDPPFAGPAAGLAVGIEALPQPSGHVLVLACDLVHSAALVPLLVSAWAGSGPQEGVMAVDAGRRQPLAAIYPLGPLHEAVATARAAHRLNNASLFSLLARVNTTECPVPEGLAADIDTWEDARRHGAVSPP